MRIVAPNYKSFMDAFFVGMATRRPVRFMANDELFRGPLGPLLVRLGAFPPVAANAMRPRWRLRGRSWSRAAWSIRSGSAAVRHVPGC